MDEEVLVFSAKLLEELGPFTGFSANVDRYLPAILQPANLSYLARSRAEDDPTFKQIIPYAVLRRGEQVYCYERGAKGGESRLHQLLSLGIGGHICKQDGEDGQDPYQTGFRRELAEEVAIFSGYTSRIVGLVHDDTTPVGRVHFGIVHLLDVAEPAVQPRDPALSNAGFRPIAEVISMAPRFETWSQLVLANVFAK